MKKYPHHDEAGALQEFSVVYTDRARNHMSAGFQRVMNGISATLKEAYGAAAVAIVPGGGTFAMEAVARQFATGARTLVIRNGWFSFRWTQILEAGAIASSSTVVKARRTGEGPQAPFAPPPLGEVVRAIESERPDVVFAPHVETASGIVLPDGYVRSLADATHAVGGLFVLDCIASGPLWVDLRTSGVDVLVSAPQKGWSGPACAGFVALSPRAAERLLVTSSTSFACDLKKWVAIMAAYEGGGHAYHATMPTDALAQVHDAMLETKAFGWDRAREAQRTLGTRIRSLLASKGFSSVAAPGFEAPTVVVVFADDPELRTGKKFAANGVQVAAGVPLQLDEGPSYGSFRVGLFGLDKLGDVDGTVGRFASALERVTAG